MPEYNPWGTPIFPGASAFGVGSPAEDAQRQPTIVDNLLSHIAGAIGRGFMAPGQALQSTTPITSDQMIAPAQDMSTVMSTGAGAFPASANELRMGIKAYHGSPHDFDAFDLSKIGTGEGAQAYGHGLYFAEHEPVARQYRDQLQWKNADFNDPQVMAQNAIDRLGDRQTAADSLQSGLDSVNRFHRGNPPASQAEANAKTEQAIALLRGNEPITGKPNAPGRMYEVNINADPEHFLDWDKPLGQQHPVVQEAATKLAGDRMNDLLAAQKQYGITNPLDTLTGSELIHGLKDRAINQNIAAHNEAVGKDFSPPSPQALAAQSLREAGIPGIKYLDQGSRPIENLDILKEALAEAKAKGNIESAKSLQATIDAQAKQTSNYVVFNDKLIDILKKYAIPGMMAPIFPQVMGERKS